MLEDDCKPSLEEIAAATGGDIVDDDQVLAPGPGHSPEDRSLSIKITENDEDGYICNSFAGDDWQACKAHIRKCLEGEEKPVYQKAQSKPRGNTVEYYVYRDKTGENHHRVERTDTKNFFQYRWTGSAWESGAPEQRLPYRLPEVLEADPSLSTVLVEGEKDANRAAELGFVSTTIPGGANSKWNADLAEWFRGRRVVIIPDNDTPGQKYLSNAATQLQGVASDVCVVELPGLGPCLEKHGKDLSDWLLLEGNTPEKLRELIDTAPSWDPFKEPAAYEEEIKRLASLSAVQYERERSEAAKLLGMRASALDAVVKVARKDTENNTGQGRAFEIADVEAWDTPVSGPNLFDELVEAIKQYVVLPSHSATTLALWVVHTHCYRCFGITPRAGIVAPENRCGKTTLLDVLEHLVSRPLSSASLTAAVAFRVVELTAPTMLIDEADTFLKDNDELRGILNAGHRRGGKVLRSVGDDHEPREFSVWAPAAIALIGRLPDTLQDRSILINMRRKLPEETVRRFRHDRTSDLDILARKVARWAKDHETEIAASDPDMGALFNRVADNWRPLFSIADAAGGHWPKTVRAAAAGAEAVEVDTSIKAMLLRDIRWILDGRPDEHGRTAAIVVDRIWSMDLVAQLASLEGQPWAEWSRGKPITQRKLANLLDDFKIDPKEVRIGDKTNKGYLRSAFEDVFARYISPSQTATPQQPSDFNDLDGKRSATKPSNVAVPNEANPLKTNGCCPVADEKGVSSDEEGVVVEKPKVRRTRKPKRERIEL
jgi:Protein of unknown function (DUF3631)